MPNEYSVMIHDFISGRIADARQKKAGAAAVGDDASILYWRGHLDELNWLRTYFKEHTDLKDFDYY